MPTPYRKCHGVLASAKQTQRLVKGVASPWVPAEEDTEPDGVLTNRHFQELADTLTVTVCVIHALLEDLPGDDGGELINSTNNHIIIFLFR
jgi:hypothetical protein